MGVISRLLIREKILMMKKNKTTRSKKFSLLGWFVYSISFILGAFDHVDFALIGFTTSYIILFLWSVHYRKPQLDKGLLMIMTGSFFVVVLTSATGLEVNDDKIFDVPDQMRMSFTVLVTIAGATFFGAGGSMIANVAAEHASDRPILTISENKLLLDKVEDKLKRTNRLLWVIILLVVIAFIVLLVLIGSLHK